MGERLMREKFKKAFDFLTWDTWMFVIVNVFYFGNLLVNKRMSEGIYANPKVKIIMWLVIITDILYLGYIFYVLIKNQYTRFKTRKLRFAMNNGGFTQTLTEELDEIFKKYPINPYHMDIGETQEYTREWAIHQVIGCYPCLLEKSFYNMPNCKERERFRKSIRHFDTELFFMARDNYIDLIEGDHYKEQFEDALEQNTHMAMKEISKMVTRLFND